VVALMALLGRHRLAAFFKRGSGVHTPSGAVVVGVYPRLFASRWQLIMPPTGLRRLVWVPKTRSLSSWGPQD